MHENKENMRSYNHSTINNSFYKLSLKECESAITKLKHIRPIIQNQNTKQKKQAHQGYKKRERILESTSAASRNNTLIDREKTNSNFRKNNFLTSGSKTRAFAFSLYDKDMEICTRTAASINNTRQSINIDAALTNHLSLLAYASEQLLYDQLRNAQIFHEELRRLEIAKWLSSRSAQERQEYLTRNPSILQFP